ncbi:DUF1465 family protein [Sphingorhabdus sp. Alg239-R122]|uniref:DUF1465 family protein n=1 Tax=Sphingorhabdus sp. Alg239-R122 TaxID=2305989 RepID=UPI0013DB4345|nr:DUF1465 family protein [Sphingorhabdus sp. Alg239-R122]
MQTQPPANMTPHLVESLYVEAMVLADEARHYFEEEVKERETGINAATRVAVSCESLRLTTRLMHCIAWLLNQKAYFAGELSYTQLRSQGRMLDNNNTADPDIVRQLPEKARQLVHASEFLFARIKRIERHVQNEWQDGQAVPQDAEAPSQVHVLQQGLLDALRR